MYNTETFIKKAKEKHGDFYDYSCVDYKGSREKVEIICPKHGSFWQRADVHLSGKGCYLCGHEKTGLATRKNIRNVVECQIPDISIVKNPKLCTNKTIVGTIYIFINNLNNKVYIGKTIDSYTYRWSSHKHDSELFNYYFYKAIRKYGWDNFSKYVIYQTEELENNKENKKYLDNLILNKEKYYIKQFNSNNPNVGYNLTEGGEGTSGKTYTEEQLSKIKNKGKIVLQCDLNGNIIKEWPSMKSIKDNLGLNLDNIRACCNNKRDSWKGYLWKFKIIKNSSKKETKQVLKVILQYDIFGNFIKEWESASKIQEELGLDNHTIRGCCRGDYNTCGNYIWLYKQSDKINYHLDKEILKSRKLYNPFIAQYDLSNNLIALWLNTSNIEEKTEYSRTSINDCLRDRSKTSYGYIWKKVERDSIDEEILNKFKQF